MGCRDLDWIGRRHLKTEDLVGEMRKEPDILFHHFTEGAREVPFRLSGGKWIITERSRDTGEVREVILRWLPWKQLFPHGLRGFYRVIRNLLRYCHFQRQFLVIQMPILNFPHRTNQEKDGLPKQTNVDTMILKSQPWWHLKAEKWWWAFFKLVIFSVRNLRF